MIMSPGPEHEETHLVLSSVAAVVAEEFGIEFIPAGHTTYRRPGSEQELSRTSASTSGTAPWPTA
jgi:hypothetical protein